MLSLPPTPQRGKALLLGLICVSLLFLLYSFHDVVSYNFTQITIYSGGGARARQPVPLVPAPWKPATDAESEPTTPVLADEDPPDDPTLIVNQASCKIPRTEILPAYFQKGSKGAWHTNWSPKCDYERQLATLEHDEFLRLLPAEEGAKDCCVHEITRKGAHSDQGYTLGECEPLRTSTHVYGKELLLVRCGDRLNFETTFPTNKPAVVEKFKHWNTQPETNGRDAEVEPISVLFLGIDSVSRSHAYRSLPRTLDFMTSALEFVDFQGYHSTSGSTLTNFMAFLMGTTRSDVRRTCAPDWHSTFDRCPLIWQEFGAARYVTMYVEDGTQTFNWGGQSGFAEPPTDFYAHPLFNAMLPLRKKHSPTHAVAPGGPAKKWNDDLHAYCSSNETVPQFMARYTRRFAEKFSAAGVPFFGFSFFAYPFHDDIYSLPTMDDDFLALMKALAGNSALLERTFIVLLSDHGDRTSFFHSASIEAYIERALPPLFVRVPEALKRRFPQFEEALRFNAGRRLVTPFDLHHTLRHLLHLDGRGTEEESFRPVLEDRSSLFVRLAGTRTCEKLHLLGESCACNTAAHGEPMRNPFVLNKLMPFMQKTLNEVVQMGGYAGKCARWSTDVDSVLSSQVLSNDSASTDVLLKFSAEPLEAHFEAKVRIAHVKSEFDGAELLGTFTRINTYGEQSACIAADTDKDKEMKELCVCAELVKGKKGKKKTVRR